MVVIVRVHGNLPAVAAFGDWIGRGPGLFPAEFHAIFSQ
jgi:hypothetical protein